MLYLSQKVNNPSWMMKRKIPLIPNVFPVLLSLKENSSSKYNGSNAK